jgi:hypothetical protein
MEKTFLKIKNVGEERYFKDSLELWRFCESQEGITAEDIAFNEREWLQMRYPDFDLKKKTNRFVSGGFLFRVFRGNFSRTSGDYTINILAEQRADNLSPDDLRRLIR